MRVSDNTRGLILAVVSSGFIGASFILKKMGLKRAGASGGRAEFGGYAYLLEPLWWIGMITMLVGETANFVAYVFAPAVLVTPLGAMSIIINAILAHFILKERLQKMGILGCISCVVGSVVIVIHAPEGRSLSSVEEIWILATQPAFLLYSAATLAIVLALILHFEPHYGQSNILVYLSICSLMGSLTVVSIKAIGIAIKLTLEGISQIVYPQTWLFVVVAIVCVVTQLKYLNKANSSGSWIRSVATTLQLSFYFRWSASVLMQALDTFNTAMVSPIYYVMFTTLTIVASAIMFKDWYGQSLSSIASELCGFITVLSGTVLLHKTIGDEINASGGSIDAVKDVEGDHFVALLSSEYVK